MQEAFFPSQNLPPDSVRLNVCVTVGSVQPGNCDNSFSPGGEGKIFLLPEVSVEQICVIESNQMIS